MGTKFALRGGAAAVFASQLLAAETVLGQTSPSAYTTGYRYDASRQLTGTISPDPDASGPLKHAAVRNSYDGKGRLIKVENGELSAWQSEVVAPSAWSGFTIFQTQDIAYDALNNKVRETVIAAGATQTAIQYSYDAAGRLECTAIRMNPAAFGSLPTSACTLSPEGSYGPDRITKNIYDAIGQIIQVRKAVGTSHEQAYATYSYTLSGKPEYIVDSNGNRARLTWDGHDRQDAWYFPSPARPSAFNPATQATVLASAGAVSSADYEQYGYDSNGNRTSLRKRDGRTLAFSYDALNRLTLKVVPDGSGLPASATRDVYYGYDLRGLQTSARFDSASGEGITNGYDGFGRLVSSNVVLDGVTRILSHQWNANGNRTRVTHPDGNYFSYQYDGLNRVTSILENGSVTLATFSYDVQGRRSGLSRGNGTAISYGYDSVSRLTSLSHDIGGSSSDMALNFAYNSASQITSRATSNDSYVYIGDVNVVRNYATNGLNQYTSAGPANFTYDPNGNLTSDGGINFVYDVENRLIGASGAKAAALVYDPMGRLYQTSGGSAGTTRLVYDGDELVAEYDSSGNILRRYIHDTGVDDPLVWYEGAVVGSNRRTLQSNHQGSIISIADSGGNLVAVNSYDAWGIPGAANLGRFQYTGQIMLPEIGVYHYKGRTYSPTLGRFLQTDPVGYQDQIHLYAYVGNDPVTFIDPTGRQRETLVIGIHAGGGKKGTSAAFATGHAWITLHNPESGRTDTYALWPDHYAGRNGEGNDIRKNFIFDSNRPEGTARYESVPESRRAQLESFLKSNQTYGEFANNCTDFAAAAFEIGTGRTVDATNSIGVSTPAALEEQLQKVDYGSSEGGDVPQTRPREECINGACE